ncbi:UDP-diphosphatase [bacterium]|nr:UDP-diphosphatase [bacterium]|tara:strand:+ start:11124 stop:11915 length:792 start_codon:yes stop_codon:yes gene_type:complete
MIEEVVLGAIQGIAEWLPVSSEGLIALAEINIFKKTGIEDIIELALFLHLGTFLAALIYLRKDVITLIKTFFSYKSAEEKDRVTLKFLVISTIISGILGFGLLKLLIQLGEQIELSGKVITGAIGLLLIGTAALQIKRKEEAHRKVEEINWKDSIALGIAQGIAVLPGLSRSGLTIGALLLRKINDTDALRLSFLMSLPIVLAGNIILNIKSFVWSLELFVGLLFSFLFGIVTIHILLTLARKVNLGYFILIFGLIMIGAAFI